MAVRGGVMLQMPGLTWAGVLVFGSSSLVASLTLARQRVVPGFPQMAWPMIEWVLDAQYRHLLDRDRWAEASIVVYGTGESTLIPAMESVEKAFDKLRAFSLPSMGPGATRRHVELGVRGDPAQVALAIEEMRRQVRAAGFAFDEGESPMPG